MPINNQTCVTNQGFKFVEYEANICIYMKGKKRRYEGYVKKVKLESQEGDQESDC